jgi:hypothetical protein
MHGGIEVPLVESREDPYILVLIVMVVIITTQTLTLLAAHTVTNFFLLAVSFVLADHTFILAAIPSILALV